MICFSSEQIENIIAMIKKFCVCNGTGKPECFAQIAKFVDLYCVGTVKKDLIDFHHIQKQLQQEKLLIFDQDKTPQLWKNEEERMKRVFKIMVDEAETLNVGESFTSATMIGRVFKHGDIATSEMTAAELNAYDGFAGVVNEAFYVDEQN